MSDTTLFVFRSDEFVSFCNDFLEMPTKELTISTVEVSEQELNEKWKNVSSQYEKAMTTSDPASNDAYKESASAKYKSCSKIFTKTKARILDYKRSYESLIASRSKETGKNSNSQFSQSLNLLPCDIEPFHGSYEQWPSFRDLFSSVFIDNANITPVQRLFYLHSKTRGLANNIVKKFPLVGESFDLAWKALRARFEDEQIVIDKQIDAILNIASFSHESSHNIQVLQNTINDSLAILETLNVDVTNWDPLLIRICTSKIPQITLTMWEQSREGKSGRPTWDDMNSFLTARYKLVEKINASKSQKFSKPLN